MLKNASLKLTYFIFDYLEFPRNLKFFLRYDYVMTLNVAFYDKISILLPQLWMHFVSGNFLLNRIFRNWLKSTLTLEISSLTVLCLAKMPIIVKFAKLKPGLKMKKKLLFFKIMKHSQKI